MDFTPVILNLITTIWWFIPLIIVISLFKTPFFKGYFGELLVNIAIKLLLDKKKYHLIKNVTLPTEDGSTQIDHILLSRHGIFVVETKNMKGWIFGSAHQKQWTQKIYKHTTKFQNPLHQNYKHTKVLAACLDVPYDNIFSVIVFVGDSEFKTDMPENVTHAGGLIRFIKSKTATVFSDSEEDSLINKIESGRLQPSLKTHRNHVQHVKEIQLRKDTIKLCPKCGSPMVLRTVKKGPNAGKTFWGCTHFPKCRSTQRT